MRDLLSNVAEEMGIAAATATTGTQTSAIIDLKEYNSACFVIHTHAWTNGTFTLSVEEGDSATLTDAAAATVANGSLHADSVLVATAANQRIFSGYKGDKRYVRLTLTAASAAQGAVVGVDVLEGHPLDAPVTH